MTEKAPALMSHHRINQLQKQVHDAYKVREILIAVGKVSREEFEQAEALVRDLAPDSPPDNGPAGNTP